MLKTVLGLTLLLLNANASGFESNEQINLLFFGAFAMMIIYNFGYYIIIKSSAYASYFLFHSLVFIIMLFYTRTLSDSLLEFSLNSVPVGLFLMATAALLAFSRDFLELKDIDERLSDGTDYLIYTALALFFLSSFGRASLILEDLAIIFVILVASILLGVSIYLSFMRKKVYAYFYLFGFSSIFLITVFVFSSHFDLFSLNSNVQYLFESSILLEAAIFSFAISYKHKETIVNLRQNEVLFKELSHRIKNNLQSVISLLTLQKGRAEDIKLKEGLQEAIKRIGAISLIHEKLQDTKRTGKIDIYTYLNALLDEYRRLNNDVAFRLNCDKDIYLNIEKLTALGLLVNELITNSIKHAFTSIDSPTILLDFHDQEDNYKFTYEDNGNGFASATPSLGSLLIDNQAKSQLKGSSSIDSKDRYLYSLSFPKD